MTNPHLLEFNPTVNTSPSPLISFILPFPNFSRHFSLPFSFSNKPSNQTQTDNSHRVTAMRGRSSSRKRSTAGAATPFATRGKNRSSMVTRSASPATNLSMQLDSVSLQNQQGQALKLVTSFEKLLEGEDNLKCEDPGAGECGNDGDEECDEKELCILSQDFFCTPDYITPDTQEISKNNDFNKENYCPSSPVKSTNLRNKKRRQRSFPAEANLNNFLCVQQVGHAAENALELNHTVAVEPATTISQKKQNYVSQSAVTLRCRVMPPPCIRNPFSHESESIGLDLFYDRKAKITGSVFSQQVVGGDGLSRYHTDFHEIEQIGFGSFSRVFKALRRIDGCMYAVKHSIRQLHDEPKRRQALMEVQALAALGYHENIVGYHTSWFENDKLYIQMELCDHSLAVNRSQTLPKEEILEVLYQIAKALQFIHEHGIAHLDVKPENIYVKNDIYKLGDFGFATRTNKDLPIEEGDSRYMPLEIFNENYDHLDKVDIFSLGASTYELVKGSPLPESGAQFTNLRDGKIPLLPGYTLTFQNLLKAMMDPNPTKRPSAREVTQNSIFDKARRTIRSR